ADPEEQDGERRWIETPTQEEPVRDDRLHDEPAREGVEAEEERKLGDRPRRPVDPEEAPLALDLREFDPVAEGEEDREIEKPDHRVEGEERAVRVGAVQTLRGEEAHRCGGERSKRAREVRRGVVDGEQPGPWLVRRGLRKDGLLDGLEDPDL